MRISELATRAGESVPTLKFYIREGLLPPGKRTGRTQALYSEEHVKRLELIRLLKEELNMSLERIGEIIRSAESGGAELLRTGLDAAQETRHGKKLERVDREVARAWKELNTLEESLGWSLSPEDPAWADAAQALAAILRAFPEEDPQKFLPRYAELMQQMAAEEIPDDFDPIASPWESFRLAILGTYLYEPLILALRRMAHSQRSTELYLARQKNSSAELPPRK